MSHWMPDPAEWDAVTKAIEKDRDLSAIPYPAKALAFSALEALANRDRGAVGTLERIADSNAALDGAAQAAAFRRMAKAALATHGGQ